MKDFTNIYEEYIKLAIKNLKENDYNEAEECIKQAMMINPHSAAVHNLYGILEEYLQEYKLARNHYRAAYALDPTNKSAIQNLERISTFYNNSKKVDYGDRQEEEEQSPYFIEYDKNQVGHLYKK